ncbi:MAG: hypothetical protein KJO76_05435 [Gammaproteobacteria bacterium]|nr:hypothetical protein [Gammaproteobacteria bacterium]
MHAVTRRNLAWSLFAVVAVLIALTGAVDRIGEADAEAALKRALVTFAVSRALNGAISVAQGTELAIEPAGVGVVLTLGQVLDPINDLVERFSGVMLVAASSLGLQNLLLDITSAGIFNVALIIGALLMLVTAWWPGEAAGRWSNLARRILLGVVFVRFAIPVLVIVSTLVFDVFLAAEQAASIEALEGVQARIEEINEQPAPAPAPDESVMDRLGALLDRSLDSIDISDRLDRLQTQVSQTSEHVVNLIVIFVLQTILIPIAFIWLFVEALKGVGKRLTRN